MANIADILARARVIATGMGLDPNSSAGLDNKVTFRAMLDSALSTVYNKRAKDPKGFRDLAVRHAVAMVAGSGAIPSELMRAYLHTADFSNGDGDLISYLEYPMDNNASAIYQQLGYVIVQGDDFVYTTPSSGAPYTGTMNVTAISLPALPSNSTDPVPITDEIFDDVCYTLALAVRGEEKMT